jgi:nucleoporin POM152
MDAPWDVEVVYRPFGGDGSGSGSGEGAGKRYKAWKKSLTTLKGKRELSLRASAPGEYTIVGVKGKVRLLLFGVEDG